MYLSYFVWFSGGFIDLSDMKRAAFFDRDGTINVDVGYLYKPEELAFVKGTPELIRSYNEKGYLIIVVTNQSGIARGMYTVEDMKKLHKIISKRLEDEYRAHIDAFYYCPHLAEITGRCHCRKPEPGLFLKAIEDYNIDPEHSVSFGDSERDEEASQRAGITEFHYIK